MAQFTLENNCYFNPKDISTNAETTLRKQLAFLRKHASPDRVEYLEFIARGTLSLGEYYGGKIYAMVVTFNDEDSVEFILRFPEEAADIDK